MSSGRSYTTTFKTKAETKGISEMQGKLRDLQKSLSETKREEKALTKEVTTAEKEIAKINKQISKTGEATEEQKKDLERLSKTVKDGKDALEALKLKESQLQSQINDTNKKIEEERAALEKLKTSMADTKKYSTELVKEFGALGAAATAAVAGLFAFTKGSAQWADDLNTLSKQTGISTEELQKFAYASDIIDVSTETMTGSLTKLTRNMQSAAEGGTSAAAKAFQELGISITDASGQLRDRQEVFYEAIDALGRIESVTERDAVAMNIFGRSAQELNPLILGGAQTLKELGDEAERAGLILDQTTLNGLNDFNNKIDLLKAKGTQIKNLAASEMTPALDGLLDVANELLDEINKMAKSGELKKIAKEAGKLIKDGATALKNLISFVWKYKEAIGAVVVGMMAFKVSLSISGLINSLVLGFKALKVATDSETTSMGALNAVMAANPIGLVISLVVALTAGLLSYSIMAGNSAEQTDKMTESVKKYTEALRDAEDQQKKSIADAVGEGDKLKVLQKEYDALREKAYLTRHEKERLDAVAESIAGTLGKEIGEIKNLQGAYIDLNSEINTYIDNLLKKAKQEAAENVIKEAYASMYELEAAMEDVSQKAADLEKKISLKNSRWGSVFEQWEFNAALREFDLLLDEYQAAKEKADRAAESIRYIGSAADDAGKLVDAFGMVIGVATGKAVAFAKSSEELAEELEEVQKQSTSLRSEMSSLASSMNQLEQGQTLSLDTILNLIDKYPEYAGMLIEAADNADLQKRALETLFEAKKNEYIITQEAALADVEASNSVTDNLIKNTMTQVKALNLLVQMKGIAGQAAASIASSTGQELLGLIGELGAGMSKANELRGKIEIAQKLTPGNYSTSSKTSGNSSGSGSSSSTNNSKYTTDASGVHAEGDTYIRMYATWMDRMKNMGKLTVQQEITLLEKLLNKEVLTGEERYELQYKLYKAREELAKDEEKKQEERLKRQEEAAKKQQEALLERQKLAKAAFDKLVNDRISAYEAEADAAKQSADAQIKAIDDVEAKRKRTQEREKREKELAVINAKLTYEHDMTTSQRFDLERRRQEILNEQHEANYQRAIEIKKANIQSRSDAVQSRTQQAIDGLNAAKNSLSDRLAYLQGTQNYDQRVANNSKTVNINLINNGLTEDQAASRIVQRVIKELG